MDKIKFVRWNVDGTLHLAIPDPESPGNYIIYLVLPPNPDNMLKLFLGSPISAADLEKDYTEFEFSLKDLNNLAYKNSYKDD